MQPRLSSPAYSRSELNRPSGERDHEVQTGSLSLCQEVSVRADIPRLFQALTVPEYIETWLTLPGHQADCSTIAARNDDEYSLEHFCLGRPSVSISGRYLVCRRRDITFSWRVEGELRAAETRVDIRLRGDFERTTLWLRHSGFVSGHDLTWHSALWKVSMSRLAALYGASDRLRPSLQRNRRRPVVTYEGIAEISPF